MRTSRRSTLTRIAVTAAVTAATVLGMATTAGAVFGGERLLFRGPREATEPQPPEEREQRQRTRDIGLTEKQARPLVERYYASHGQWAGQYVIDEIPRVRFVQHGSDRVHAHIRYRYRCVIDRCGGSQQVGYDERVFYFERRDGRWQIIWMGGHMSAKMDKGPGLGLLMGDQVGGSFGFGFGGERETEGQDEP